MKILKFMLLLLISHGAFADPLVTIFTTHSRPAIGVDRAPATIYYLDDAAILNHKMGAGLPKDKELAMREVVQRLNTPEGANYMKEIGPATERLVIAWMWGVRALPAVVIEDKGVRSVVYGTSNSAEALAIWTKTVSL